MLARVPVIPPLPRQVVRPRRTRHPQTLLAKYQRKGDKTGRQNFRRSELRNEKKAAAVQGQILTIDRDRKVATISLGIDDTIKKNMRFEVRVKKAETVKDRSPLVKGTVEVTTVERDRSEVRILTEDAANNLAKDHDVVLVEEKPANVDPQAIRTAGENHGQLLGKGDQPIVGATIACRAVINDSGQGGGANSITDAEGRYPPTFWRCLKMSARDCRKSGTQSC